MVPPFDPRNPNQGEIILRPACAFASYSDVIAGAFSRMRPIGIPREAVLKKETAREHSIPRRIRILKRFRRS
jgi:hypothetical protein